jgi:glycosyltransferase involved in cell wall biosynthesis
MQIRDGAPPQKCMLIPNGVDCEKYGALPRPGHNRPPTIAFIGRVVPIKDVKTYLHAVALLKKTIPGLQALVLGPTDEDPDYFAECVRLTRELGLQDAIAFPGSVALKDYLPQIHLNVLTSLSEAQPLVLLEAGAAGIPSVASDVGACREMIYGRADEEPKLGPGGAITPIGDAYATAEAIAEFLLDRERLSQASLAIRARVLRYYSKPRMDASYRHVYGALMARNPSQQYAAQGRTVDLGPADLGPADLASPELTPTNLRTA